MFILNNESYKYETLEGLIFAIDEIVKDTSLAKNICILLCKELGGAQCYIPRNINKSKFKDLYLGILEDVVDKDTAIKIFKNMGVYCGARLIYIPLFSSAFRDEIAKDIYDNYDGTNKSLRASGKKHNISFTKTYKLYHRGKSLVRDKYKQENER